MMFIPKNRSYIPKKSVNNPLKNYTHNPMNHKWTILLFAFSLAALGDSFDRSIAVGLSGLECIRPSAEAVVEQPRDDFRWLEARWRYSLGGAAVFRDYEDDDYGLYSSGAIYGTIGRIDIIGGFIGLDFAAALHLSRIKGGYEFTDIVAGTHIYADYTFWADRTCFETDMTFLIGSDFLVAWGGVNAYPLKNLSLGAGVHYDGELDHWGDTPFLEDYWENGLNLYLSIGYRFGI